MLGKHVIFPFSSINYMFPVNYIIFLNITYVFAIITCLGFLVGGGLTSGVPLYIYHVGLVCGGSIV